jgi:hypothetical protein
MNIQSQPNTIKLAACVLLLTEGTQVMRTALNKHLFFADIAYCLMMNDGQQPKTITLASYRKLPYGPVPDGIDWVRSNLISSGHLQESVKSLGDYYQYQYTATSRVNFTKIKQEIFKPQELDIINNVKQYLGRNTATELSNWSHDFEPWKSSAMNETLDFRKALDDENLRKFLREKNILQG